MEASRRSDSAILVFTRQIEREEKRYGLGAVADRRLGRYLIERTLRTVDALRDEADILVAVDGTLGIDLKESTTSFAQRGQSFDQRFGNALSDGFALGYDRIVVVGSDTPGLDPTQLRRAICSDDVAVGWSPDGGFYLLGLRPTELDLVERLPWCTCSVRSVLESRISERGLEAICVGREYDLDGPVDVARMLRWLTQIYWRDCGTSLFESFSPVTARPIVSYAAAHVSSNFVRGPPLA